MSDEEDYDFEYSDEEESDEKNRDYELENQYYEAKVHFESKEYEKALDGLNKVILYDQRNNYAESSVEWGFKALKQLVQVLFSAHQHERMMEAYKRLLEYVVNGRTTRNAGEEAIINILDLISSFSSSMTNKQLLLDFYKVTLVGLTSSKTTNKLWFKINLKLSYLYLNIEDYTALHKLIKDLNRHLSESCPKSGLQEHRKGAQELELCALEIQLYTHEKDNRKLREIYEKALIIKAAAIPHPTIHAIIRECGGKMHMHERSWDKARNDFFEAFKNYDQAGDSRRIKCLKYLVLANMLTGSKINPFESQETKSYENHKDIKVMTSLVDAFLHQEVRKFEIILQANKNMIMEDEFLSMYISELLKAVRCEVIQHMVKPYKRISLYHISKELVIPVSEVETLLVDLLLDERIHGSIDQEKMILNLQVSPGVDLPKYKALNKLTEELIRVNTRFGI